jgi:REP element-mobilizing transposase RayT
MRVTISGMVVYLITLHAYRSWMPDRPQGYVRRRHGILPTDMEMAKKYESIATQSELYFDEELQQLLIDEALVACEKQQLDCHFIATDSTHAHLLLRWTSTKSSADVRKSIKSSLTRRLNRERKRRTWFSRSGSRGRVEDESHFHYLMETYLPSHRGWKWSETRGLYK